MSVCKSPRHHPVITSLTTAARHPSLATRQDVIRLTSSGRSSITVTDRERTHLKARRSLIRDQQRAINTVVRLFKLFEKFYTKICLTLSYCLHPQLIYCLHPQLSYCLHPQLIYCLHPQLTYCLHPQLIYPFTNPFR